MFILLQQNNPVGRVNQKENYHSGAISLRITLLGMTGQVKRQKRGDQKYAVHFLA